MSPEQHPTPTEDIERPPRKRSLWWRKFLLLLLASLVALALGEAATRAIVDFKLVDGELIFGEPHDEGAGVTIEEVDGVAIWRRSHAGRSEPQAVKTGFRLVVIGDSVLVPARLTAPEGAVAKLEQSLNAEPGANFEVVNLAQGGWNGLHYEIEMRARALELDPDLIVVGLTPNDTQRFVYRSGQLFLLSFDRALDTRPIEGLGGPLVRHSYLFNAGWLALYRHAQPDMPREQGHAVLDPVQRMVALAQEHEIPIAFMCFPERPSGERNPPGDRCLFQQVERWIRKQGVPLFNPSAAYEGYLVEEFWMDHIHLSAQGHSVLAAAWQAWLFAEGLLPESAEIAPR